MAANTITVAGMVRAASKKEPMLAVTTLLTSSEIIAGDPSYTREDLAELLAGLRAQLARFKDALLAGTKNAKKGGESGMRLYASAAAMVVGKEGLKQLVGHGIGDFLNTFSPSLKPAYAKPAAKPAPKRGAKKPPRAKPAAKPKAVVKRPKSRQKG